MEKIRWNAMRSQLGNVFFSFSPALFFIAVGMRNAHQTSNTLIMVTNINTSAKILLAFRRLMPVWAKYAVCLYLIRSTYYVCVWTRRGFDFIVSPAALYVFFLNLGINRPRFFFFFIVFHPALPEQIYAGCVFVCLARETFLTQNRQQRKWNRFRICSIGGQKYSALAYLFVLPVYYTWAHESPVKTWRQRMQIHSLWLCSILRFLSVFRFNSTSAEYRFFYSFFFLAWRWPVLRMNASGVILFGGLAM